MVEEKINPSTLSEESWQNLTSVPKPIYYFYSRKLDTLLKEEFSVLLHIQIDLKL